MALVRLTFILLFCSVLFMKCLATDENEAITQGTVSAILKHLNANPNKVYNYKNGTIVNAQQKGYIAEITLEVDVDCLNNYPEVPCSGNILTCTGFVQLLDDEPHTYEVLSEVNCKPPTSVSAENTDVELAPPLPKDDGKIELSHEAASSESGERFVAVRRNSVPCVGCPFDLNTDAEGVPTLIDTALKHVESEREQRHTLLRVIRLQEQVVAGVKYILLLEMAPTTCRKDADLSSQCPIDKNIDPITCEVTYLQKPWISKAKHIIQNNCTTSQEFLAKEIPPLPDRRRNDLKNEIDINADDLKQYLEESDDRNPKPVPNFDAMAQSGHMDGDLSQSQLSDLESQIIYDEGEPQAPKMPPVYMLNSFQSPVEETVARVEEYHPMNAGLIRHYVNEEVINPNIQPEVVPEGSIGVQVHDMSYSESMDQQVPEPMLHPYMPQGEYQPVFSQEPQTFYDNPIYSGPSEFFYGPYDAPTSESSLPDNRFAVFDVFDSFLDQIQGDQPVTTEEPITTDEIATTNETPAKKVEDGPTDDSVHSPTGDTAVVAQETADTAKSSTKNPINTKSSEEKSSEEVSSEEKSNKTIKKKQDRSEESSEEKKNRVKRSDSDSSSSSSSSSSEENNGKTEEKYEKTKTKENVKGKSNKINKEKSESKTGDCSDSSSSSSSESEENNNKQKRSIGQLEKISPDEKPLIKDLADYAASTLDKIDDDKYKRIVLQILGAKKLKLDGVYYSLILRLGVSHCLEDKYSDNEDCKDSLFENLTKICKVQVHVDDDLTNPKVVKSQCQNIKKDEHDRNRTNYGRYKRGLVGGASSVPVDDSRILTFAKSTLPHLDSLFKSENKHKLVEILSATSQIVSGVKYNIKAKMSLSDCTLKDQKDPEKCNLLKDSEEKICKIVVWDRPWIPSTKTSVQCDDAVLHFESNEKRSKRSLKGGVNPHPVDDPKVKELLVSGLQHLDSQSGHENKFKIQQIISVTKQVVAGSLWKIHAKIILSDCSKKDKKDSKDCGELQGTESRTCEFKIWDRPWLKDGKETNITCENDEKAYSFKSKRSVPEEKKLIKKRLAGGKVDHSTSDPKVLEYLKGALVHLDSQSSHSNKLKIQEVLSVTKQIVSGQLWEIKAKVILSDCLQSDTKEPENCGQLTGGETRVCTFKIWDQPWLPQGKETTIECENESKTYKFRSKREAPLLGAKKYVIPSTLVGEAKPNSKVFDFIRSGLSYLDKFSKHNNKYMIKDLISVSKQTVAGELWQIKAKVAVSDCSKTHVTEFCEELENGDSKVCEFKVWDQPWLKNGQQINITCENDENEYSFKSGEENKPNLIASFKEFMTKNNKTYSSKIEYQYRLKVFKANLRIIELLNQNEMGTGVYGITRFADLSSEEFSQSHGLKPDLHNENEIPFTKATIPDIELPTQFDWRTKGAVSEVKNQGSCGSCWAFSVTGNVEGQYAIKHGQLLEFSEQELVDCDKVDEGCNGGLMDNAYRVIEKMGGLETESDYPYDARDEKCHFDKTKSRVQLSGALNISHDETDMAKWLVQNGPISIAINANAMQFYVGGVSHPYKFLCSPTNLDHGVLIVGFGVHKYPLFKKSLPFWTVKNSWGTSWGEQGYYRVYRGDGTCGLNQTPSSAIVV